VSDLPAVNLYTDGAGVSINLGKMGGYGGWSYLLHYLVGDQILNQKAESGAAYPTTNNRMELTAVVMGLRSLRRPSRVVIFSDSEYVVLGINERLDIWKNSSRPWKNYRGAPIANRDLWEEIDRYRRLHVITATWIRGHVKAVDRTFAHEMQDLCDKAAVKAKEDLYRLNHLTSQPSSVE